MRHERSQREVESLRPGQVIRYQGEDTVILKVGVVSPAGRGSYASRMVMRTLPSNDLHPFVIHRAIFQDDEPLQEAPLEGRWVFEQGCYCESIDVALEMFPG